MVVARVVVPVTTREPVVVALMLTRLLIIPVVADSSVEKNEVEVPLSAKKLVAYRLVEVLFVEAPLVVK